LKASTRDFVAALESFLEPAAAVFRTPAWEVGGTTTDEKETGFVVVQVGLEDPSKSEAFARVSAKRFESPVAPVPGRSTLFGLKLKEVVAGMSRECWVGKDLSRAHSELAFYEQ
ncbi:unnamed protein product, partial [Symbiodinium microadriaticum]